MDLEALLRECGDTTAALAAFLTRADVCSASSLSRGTCESSLRVTFLRESRVAFPPLSSERATSNFLSNLSPTARDAISFVDAADAATAVRTLRELPSVTRLWVRGQESQQAPFALSPSLFQKSLNASDSLLKNLTTLDFLSSAGVVDISALSHGSTRLESLSLAGNTLVEDFSPLKSLARLKNLNLSGTSVASVAFLKQMPDLTELNLSATKNLVDLHPMGYLTKLQTVYLSRTRITTLTPLLSSASTLELLQVAWSQFDDAIVDEWDFLFSQLTNLKHLTLLGVKKLVSLAPVGQLTNLTYLNVQACPVDVLAPLAALTKLETLVLGWSNANDFSALRSLTRLRRLDAQGKQLKSVEFLPELEYFKGFGILPRLPRAGRLQEMSFCFSDDMFTFRLAGIRHLRSLSLSGKFDLVQVAQCVPNLRQLELFVSDPVDWASVAELVQLRRLTIRFATREGASGTPQDYSFLGNLIQLRQLKLFKCDIDNMMPLHNLTHLKILHIGSPKLKDVALLQHLTELEKVHIEDTSVSNIEWLASLPKLQQVALPHRVDCSCLVAQYGGQRMPELREVLHLNRNCIWVPHT